jgi:hypothetical protein
MHLLLSHIHAKCTAHISLMANNRPKRVEIKRTCNVLTGHVVSAYIKDQNKQQNDLNFSRRYIFRVSQYSPALGKHGREYESFAKTNRLTVTTPQKNFYFRKSVMLCQQCSLTVVQRSSRVYLGLNRYNSF